MAGESRGEKRVGVISKKWGGLVREILTDKDSFGVSFPADLEPKYKALFLAACFLIVRQHCYKLVSAQCALLTLCFISFHRTSNTLSEV